MAEHLQIVLVCAGVLAYALFSRWISKSLLTLPMLFVAFGYLLGAGGFDLLDMRVDTTVLHGFAEITLVLVLFTDASTVKLRDLRAGYGLPARMLLIGMPLSIFLGTFAAMWVTPGAPLAVAVLVAVILAPTDAALGQAILNSPAVPHRLRQAINVESGLNDGIAVPLVMFAAILAAQATGTEFTDRPENLPLFALLQLTLGPAVGIGLGYCLARAIDLADARRLVSDDGKAIAVLAGALLAFTLAETVGGNGLIAAFLGGLTMGNVLLTDRRFIVEFMESEGQLLTMLTFLIFGALLLPDALAHASWKTLALALAYLSVVRMLPVWLSLTGTGLPVLHKLALGWFGPRGLASILFVLLIKEQFSIPGFEEILACVSLTVLLSVLAHGVSAQPFARLLAKRSPAEDQARS